MKRLVLAAMLLTAGVFGGSAHAACSSAGVSDTFHTRFGNIRLDIRTMGSPLTIGQPPATAAGACTDPSAGAVRGMHWQITDTSTNTVLCSRWSNDVASYDPFGFGLALGAGIHLSQDADHPCGVDATWDPVTYATGVALAGYDPTRLRFPAVETDDFGSSVGIGIGSVVSGKIWWSGANGNGEIEGYDEANSYYVRGVGQSGWAG